MLLLWVAVISGFAKSSNAFLEIESLNCEVTNTTTSGSISVTDICFLPSVTLFSNNIFAEESPERKLTLLLSSSGPSLGLHQISGVPPSITVVSTKTLPPDFDVVVSPLVALEGVVTFPEPCGHYFLIAVLEDMSSWTNFTSSDSVMINRPCADEIATGGVDLALEVAGNLDSSFLFMDRHKNIKSEGVTVIVKNVGNVDFSMRTMMDAPHIYACTSIYYIRVYNRFEGTNATLQQLSDLILQNIFNVRQFGRLGCISFRGLEHYFVNVNGDNGPKGRALKVGESIPINLRSLKLPKMMPPTMCGPGLRFTLYFELDTNGKIPDTNRTNNQLLLPIEVECDSESGLEREKGDTCEVIPDLYTDGNDALILRKTHATSFHFHGGSFKKVNTKALWPKYAMHVDVLEKAARLNAAGLCPEIPLDDNLFQNLELSIVADVNQLLPDIEEAIEETHPTNVTSSEDKTRILLLLRLFKNATNAYLYDSSHEFRQLFIQVIRMTYKTVQMWFNPRNRDRFTCDGRGRDWGMGMQRGEMERDGTRAGGREGERGEGEGNKTRGRRREEERGMPPRGPRNETLNPLKFDLPPHNIENKDLSYNWLSLDKPNGEMTTGEDGSTQPTINSTDYWSKFENRIKQNIFDHLPSITQSNRNRTPKYHRPSNGGHCSRCPNKQHEEEKKLTSLFQELHYRLSMAETAETMSKFAFIPLPVRTMMQAVVRNMDGNKAFLGFLKPWVMFFNNPSISDQVVRQLKEMTRNLTMNGAAEDLENILFYLKNETSEAVRAHFQGNPSMIELLDYSLELLDVVRSNLEDITDVAMKIAKVAHLNKDEWKLLAATPGKEPSPMMNCYRAAAKFVAMTTGMEEEEVEQSPPFYDIFSALEEKPAETPVRWMQYKSGIYMGKRSIIFGTMFWDKVAQCSCPRTYYPYRNAAAGEDHKSEDFVEGFGLRPIPQDNNRPKPTRDNNGFHRILFPGETNDNLAFRKRSGAAVEFSSDSSTVVRLALPDVVNIDGKTEVSGMVVLEKVGNQDRQERMVGTVCDEGWSTEEAVLICREAEIIKSDYSNFTLEKAQAVRGDSSQAQFFESIIDLLPPFMMNNVDCPTEARDLINDCHYDEWTLQYCLSYQRAGVKCVLKAKQK